MRNSEEKLKLVWASWNSALRSALRVFLWIAIFMMGVGLVMSYSRGAWLATAVALVYLAWCYGKLKWRYLLPVVLLIVVAASLLWSRTPESAPWYVKRADLGRPSAQHRVAAWEAGLKIMRDYPFGVGWDNAISIYEKNYSPPEGGAAALTTNDYLMIGTELGVPALLCFVVYVGLCFRKSPRIRNVEVMANHNNFGTGEAGRARHSERAALGQTHDGAHGVTRPTMTGVRQVLAMADLFGKHRMLYY
jgi:O-antigen ligase